MNYQDIDIIHLSDYTLYLLGELVNLFLSFICDRLSYLIIFPE